MEAFRTPPTESISIICTPMFYEGKWTLLDLYNIEYFQPFDGLVILINPKGRVKKRKQKKHGIFHGGVPPQPPFPWKIINIFPTIFQIFVLWSNHPETHFVWYHKFLDQILAELEHFHWRPSWSPRNQIILVNKCFWFFSCYRPFSILKSLKGYFFPPFLLIKK